MVILLALWLIFLNFCKEGIYVNLLESFGPKSGRFLESTEKEKFVSLCL